MPLPVQPAQPLIGAKRLHDAPGPSHSVDSPTADPPRKRLKVSEIEIETSETIETLEKKERDQNELFCVPSCRSTGKYLEKGTNGRRSLKICK